MSSTMGWHCKRMDRECSLPHCCIFFSVIFFFSLLFCEHICVHSNVDLYICCAYVALTCFNSMWPSFIRQTYGRKLTPHFCKIKYDRRFNSAHTCHSGALLQGRWLHLGLAGGTLLYTPDKVCNITVFTHCLNTIDTCLNQSNITWSCCYCYYTLNKV